jgi:predicted ATPase/DNA-binding XRE family transcriptional regulator
VSRRRDSTFGDLLRRLRTEAGLTQEELAERAGLSTRGISDLERGVNRWPFRATVEALIGALSPGQPDVDQLWARAARPHTPRITPGDEGTGRLPVPPTPILGRELEEAKALRFLRWEGKRLLTLTGTGGVGKTRLALQIAWTARGDYTDGAVFVPLAAVGDPALVPVTVASMLGIRAAGPVPIEAALGGYLAERELLLVLDNLEHLLPCVPFIADLLSGCPRLKVLATSREPLRLRGEQELDIGPLPVPDVRSSGRAEDLRGVPSVALFLQRAASVQPELELTTENSGAIAEICCRLEGLPLAIELAAAQVRYFSPEKLREQLHSRLDTLAGGARDLPPRQQAMRDTIAWSYQLLDPDKRAVFRQVSVFSGGFTEEAAAAVLGTGALDGCALRELVEKSLLYVDRGSDDRYGMLETIREFGVEQLVGAGAEETRQRHADHFRDLAQQAEPELIGPHQGEWLDRLETEHDNLREALVWARSSSDARLGLEICVSLWQFWLKRGHAAEGRKWLASFDSQVDGSVSRPLRAASLYASGAMAYGLALYNEARRLFQQSLGLYRELGDTEHIAQSLNGLGAIDYQHGRYDEAVPALEESVRLYREAGRENLVGAPLNNLAAIAQYEGKLGEAIRLYEECIALYRRMGYRNHLANSLNNLALVMQQTGAWRRARELARDGLELHRALADPIGQALALATLSAIELDEGAEEQAEPLILETLDLARASGETVETANALVNLGTVEFRRGRYQAAEELAREGLDLYEKSGARRSTAYALDNLGDVARARGSLHEARKLYDEALQVRRGVGDASGTADSLDRVASLACEEGAWEEAIQRYATAEAIRVRLGIAMSPVQQVQKDRDLYRMRRVMSPDAFQSAWNAGYEVGNRELGGGGS